MELKLKMHAYKFWPITALPSGFSSGNFIKNTSESITNSKYLTVSSTYVESPNQTDMKKLSSHALARRQKMVRYTRHTGVFVFEKLQFVWYLQNNEIFQHFKANMIYLYDHLSSQN